MIKMMFWNLLSVILPLFNKQYLFICRHSIASNNWRILLFYDSLNSSFFVLEVLIAVLFTLKLFFLKRQKSFQIEIVLYESGNFKLYILVKITILKQCKKEYYSLQSVVNLQHLYLDFFI